MRENRNHKVARAIAGAACCAVSLFAVQSASAQLTPANTWTGTAGDNLWATDGNWSVGSFPRIDNNVGRADNVTFSGSTTLNITIPTNASAGKLNFLVANPATVTLGTGSNTSLRAGIFMDSTSGPVSITGTTNLNGTGQSYTNNSTNTLTLGNDVTNLNNSSNILFTVDGSGPIVITGGITNSGGSPTPATTNLYKTGTGSLQIGSGSMKGNVTFDSGSIIAASGNVFGTTAKTVTINAPPIGGTTPSLSTHNTASRTIPAAISFTLNTTPNIASFPGGGLSFAGLITGTGGVNVNGGTVQFINNGNNYTGTTTVSSGKLGARANNAFGTSGGASDYTEVAGTGATASINTTAGLTINEEFRLAGDGFSDGSTGALTIENSASGTTIAGPISLTAPATIHITGTGNATFTNTNAITSPNHTLTIQGGANNTAGNGTVSGAISLGSGGLTKKQGSIWVLSGTNSWTGTTQVEGGVLRFLSNPPANTPYNVIGGVLELGAGGARMLDASSLSTSATGRLNIQDNKAVVRNGDVAGLTAQIASGYNGGAWNGATGIITTQSNAAPPISLTSLGIATAQQAKGITGTQTATFGSATVNPSDVLIKYTYAGDADLNGLIDGDDYAQIDAGYSAASTGWYNGDFNYSGNIDADDYFIIDSNYPKQTLGQLPGAPAAGAAAGVTAVPEPASVALVGMSGLALLRRRRRSD